jgi:PKD repeat protein
MQGTALTAIRATEDLRRKPVFKTFYGVAMDGLENLYIADTSNHRIRKVDVNGIITTVAGTFGAGFSGDGGPATQATLNTPYGVAVDSIGNLYIADTQNRRIRKVDVNGIITTVAGNGVPGYSGDGGPATQASFNFPISVAVDGIGNFYISDSFDSRIRKVGSDNIITTVAGNGVPGYSGDGGPATQAALNNPLSVAVDGLGNLYIADYNSNRVRKVGADNIITTVAGNGTFSYSGDCGPATQAGIWGPIGLALDDLGNLYITDDQNYRIRKVGTDNIITTVAGNGVPCYSGDGGPATQASINPWGVTLDGNGDLYISTMCDYRVRWVNMKPYASFTASPTRGYRNQSFAFNNTTRTASGTTYLWNFGDNTTSTQASPNHSFLDEGIYTVTLTATGLSGLPKDSTSKTVTDYICAGYIFSDNSATATTAPFIRDYGLGTQLYSRVWALLQDVNYTKMKTANLTVIDMRGQSVSSNLTYEGSGIFSGSVLLNPAMLVPGSGSATFAITDNRKQTFTATENIILR